MPIGPLQSAQSRSQHTEASDRSIESGELFFLSDEQWDAVSTVLPVRQRGPKRSDDRLIISGILHVLQTGCAWRDCHPSYGPYMTVFNRYLRWRHSGLWRTILERLPQSVSLEKRSKRARAGDESMAPPDDDLSFARLSLEREHARDPPDGTVEPVRAPRIDEQTQAYADVGALLRDNAEKSPDVIVRAVVEWHMRRHAQAISTLDPLSGWTEQEEPASSHSDNAMDNRLRALITILRRDCHVARTRLESALECLNLCLTGEVDDASRDRLMRDALQTGERRYPSAELGERDANSTNGRIGASPPVLKSA